MGPQKIDPAEVQYKLASALDKVIDGLKWVNKQKTAGWLTSFFDLPKD